MAYSATITSFPTLSDPTQAVVQATLTDDSGQPDIVRNYTLPVANNPQPTDFQALIQADVDGLNNAQTQANSLATSFAGASLAVPLSSELKASLVTTPIVPTPPQGVSKI